jgi:hypothetical protein
MVTKPDDETGALLQPSVHSGITGVSAVHEVRDVRFDDKQIGAFIVTYIPRRGDDPIGKAGAIR